MHRISDLMGDPRREDCHRGQLLRGLGAEVDAAIRAHGLARVDREWRTDEVPGLRGALRDVNGADIVNLRSHADSAARGVLFRGSDVVLANSGREPFDLVGLETMAVELACTGEDYVVPGHNALLETGNPAGGDGSLDGASLCMAGDRQASPTASR